jgi:hypothetical protein
MRFKVILIFIIVFGSLCIVPVRASDVTISIQNQAIDSKIVLSFHQNMTQLPKETATLEGSVHASLMSNLTAALRRMDASVQVSHVTVAIASSTTWLNVTTSMRVTGVTTQQGDIVNATTAWKSFYVDADMRAGNLSYNTVGSRYLRPVFDFYINVTRFVGRPNATITGVSFFDNATSISGPQAGNLAGNLTLFDFRPLNLTLDQWTSNYNLENNTTTWRYSPSPIIISSIKITKGNDTSTIVANYGYNAEVIVSGLARSKGDDVLIDVGSGQKELIMAAIVILTVAMVVWVQVLYRAKRKRAMLGRR